MVSEAGANAKRLGATESEVEKSAQDVAARVADENAAMAGIRTDAAQWKNTDGSNKYPPNSGFSGEITQTTLNPGTRIDRYGLEQGRYLSPEGTPFAQRSLPETTNLAQYRIYEVVKPLEVQSGEIAPWFGYPGGGTQYFTGGKKIADLIPEFLREGYPMSVEQLSELLAKLCVPRTVYSLSGGLPDEACCLERTTTGWQTYYSERGERSSLKSFATEDEACAYFIEFLQEDSHLRKIIQEGLDRMGS